MKNAADLQYSAQLENEKRDNKYVVIKPGKQLNMDE